MSKNNSKNSKSILTFDNVSIGYNDIPILEKININIEPGKVMAIMGSSGSGKTTLLRAATGQILAQKGIISIFNKNISNISLSELNQLRKKIGVLFQHGALFTDLNVFDNVMFPLKECKYLTYKNMCDITFNKLEKVGLKHAAHLNISSLSGGMIKRVALARAIILEPELIFYDEPFSGLDPISVGIIAKLIRSLSDELGCASIMITHNVNESLSIADNVHIIGHGNFIASGTPKSLLNSSDPYVIQFLMGKDNGPIQFEYPKTYAFEKWLLDEGIIENYD
ncbi:putative phospholipid import ATP-binding protein MlaF [Candidatus Kinetoplastibacterium sorsogonicusi]|uniref:Putative phospholipid import ATP-binding protein MlaF n=1 Tax=Candidatus Kinetoplastidibacterium kentomonadis TaxID=1576550 RepID=A0A3S7J925_9PROT|nr:ATP-binding cassette domain-containing protein [Candidatus Kinetoplastibacterium sorsogonicusi]AWD32179.1 putative phospholipid import ATP-binding protein MlaF [Candidatus Kinetoplastibacterium sorsogonicusi]